MGDFDFEIGGFEFGDEGDPLETRKMPSAQSALKRRSKHVMRSGMKKEELSVLLPGLEEGFTYHLVSRGNFDSFNFVELLWGRHGMIDEYWFTTWALNRENVVDMMKMYDDGKIGKIQAFIGTYLKRRETAVYGALHEGLQERGMMLKAFRNHTKIQMFSFEDGMKVVIEGSANLTANGNCENFVVSVDGGVYDFHVKWLEEIRRI